MRVDRFIATIDVLLVAVAGCASAEPPHAKVLAPLGPGL
jgi:hypothetical protein